MSPTTCPACDTQSSMITAPFKQAEVSILQEYLDFVRGLYYIGGFTFEILL